MLVPSNKKSIILHEMENVKVSLLSLRGKKYDYRASPGIKCIQNTGINETQ